MKNFWKKLPHPFTVLAPMDGVTDTVFRQIISEIGKPDVLFTEFTMVDGIMSKGRERVMQNLLFAAKEQPVVAQIWGTKPENFYKSAQMVKELGFAGIDINMGCPERTIIKSGACSALMHNPSLAAEIVQATREGAKDIPVSVKTRIGFYKETIDEWIGFLLGLQLPMLAVHLRTREEMSKVPAHWEFMPKILALRDQISPETLICGNGDIKSMDEIKEKYKEYSCDGFMVGTGIFQNPWLFNPAINIDTVTVEERIELYLRHISLYEKTYGDGKNFAVLKKFCKTYINNFPNAVSFREQLMTSKSITELKNMLKNYRTSEGTVTLIAE
jgi:tRNA-dihydrouridine synthase